MRAPAAPVLILHPCHQNYCNYAILTCSICVNIQVIITTWKLSISERSHTVYSTWPFTICKSLTIKQIEMPHVSHILLLIKPKCNTHSVTLSVHNIFVPKSTNSVVI